MAVEVRKVERLIHETGVGVDSRVEVHYELGADVEGTWVPFASVSEHRLEDFKVRAERLAEIEKAANPKPTPRNGK